MQSNVVPLPTSLPPGKRLRAQLVGTPINPDALYSVTQCQAWAGIGPSTWWRLGNLNQLPPTRKVGRRTMVKGADFIAWRDKLGAEPASTASMSVQ